MNSFVQALLIGLVYWVGTNRIWYATTTVIRQPLVMAVPLGLIMGDPVTAMVIGATLQLIYLGAIAPGGNIPADEAFAACVAIPIAIKTGISAEVAVSLAVPVGLLGVLLDTVRRTYASAFVRLADKAAADSAPCDSGICRYIFWSRCSTGIYELDSCMGNKWFIRSRWFITSTWICSNHDCYWKEKSTSVLFGWFPDYGIFRNWHDWYCNSWCMYCSFTK